MYGLEVQPINEIGEGALGFHILILAGLFSALSSLNVRLNQTSRS